MKPAPFDYTRAASVEAAIALLASAGGEARVLAGGQSLVPMMNLRIAQPRHLVDVNRIPGHDYVRREGDELVIGFLARHEHIRSSPLVLEACPLMAAAYDFVAHGPVRNRGTLCGNLCHADPASEMPAVMLATHAEMEVQGPAGSRRVPAGEFFVGLFETALRSDELLVSVRIPVAPKRQGWGFHEVSTRKGDFAFVCVAALLQVESDRVVAASISAAGIGARAVRLLGLEQSLAGQPPNEATFRQAAEDASATVPFHDDALVPGEYRRELLSVLARRALLDAAARAFSSDL